MLISVNPQGLNVSKQGPDPEEGQPDLRDVKLIVADSPFTAIELVFTAPAWVQFVDAINDPAGAALRQKLLEGVGDAAQGGLKL